MKRSDETAQLNLNARYLLVSIAWLELNLFYRIWSPRNSE